MRVLVAYASKRGGTTGIAKTMTARLRERGIDADVLPAQSIAALDAYDAYVVGSAIYRDRWQRPAIRILRRLARLQPAGRVWLFHSGPLGDAEAISARVLPKRVAAPAARLGVDEVETFGGRLESDTTGVLARRMVRRGRTGDWRDTDQMDVFADRIADSLLDSDRQPSP